MTSRPIQILLVDDDEDDRLNVRDAFESNRLANHLRTLNDGEELMAYLRREPPFTNASRPDVILLDLNMPRKTGLEALQEIRADPTLRAIPVVVLTTSKTEEDVLRSYDSGASSFITKPVSFDALVRTVGMLGTYWLQIVELPRVN